MIIRGDRSGSTIARSLVPDTPSAQASTDGSVNGHECDREKPQDADRTCSEYKTNCDAPTAAGTPQSGPKQHKR